MSIQAISVVVVDDHPLFRRGIVDLVDDSEEMQVIGQFDDAFSLLDNLAKLNPDLLLLDLQMPQMSGLETLKHIRQQTQFDALKIIMITACSEQEKIFEALRFGADGYLQKDTPSDEILSKLVSVLNGQVALNAEAVTTLASHFRQSQINESKASNAMLDNMTERERETLFYIAKGLTNKLIARELGISDGTVKIYVKNLLRKLDLHSRLELAAWTHQNLSDELMEKDA